MTGAERQLAPGLAAARELFPRRLAAVGGAVNCGRERFGERLAGPENGFADAEGGVSRVDLAAVCVVVHARPSCAGSAVGG